MSVLVNRPPEVMGAYDYQDTATASTPISMATPNTWYQLTNNALGVNTSEQFALPGVPSLYNPSINALDFSDLKFGDTVDIRIDLLVTLDSPNQTFSLRFFFAEGEVGAFELPIITQAYYKTSGQKQVLAYTGVYIGATGLLRDYPVRMKARTDGTGSIIVNGWFLKAIRG